MSRSLLRRSVLVGAVLAGLSLSPSVDAAPAEWTVTQLQPLQPGQAVEVLDINEAGVSVGSSGGRAVRWDPEGHPTALALPPGCRTLGATAIGDSGHIAGRGFCSGGANNGWAALQWDPDGTARVLPAPAYFADGVDTYGTVVGTSIDTTNPSGGQGAGTSDPYAYLDGYPLLTLPDAGATQAAAFDLTDWGYAVGGVTGVPGIPQDVAVGWYGMQVFPLLPTGRSTVARAINEYGVALVESSEGARGQGVADIRGHLVAPGGRTIDLDHAGAADVVRDLNDAGIVVGTRVTSLSPLAGHGRFYVGSLSIALRDIVSEEDSAEFGLDGPVAVNDSAWVVGTTADGRGWLLRPPG